MRRFFGPGETRPARSRLVFHGRPSQTKAQHFLYEVPEVDGLEVPGLDVLMDSLESKERKSKTR